MSEFRAAYNPQYEPDNEYDEYMDWLSEQCEEAETCFIHGTWNIPRALKERPGHIKYLLEHGVSLRPCSKSGTTLLMWPHECSEQEIRLLLDSRIDVNLKDYEFGNTALMTATITKSPAIIKMLLDAGADPNIRNNEGATALMHAWLRITPADIPEVFNLLLQAGADPNAEDQYRSTVLNTIFHALYEKYVISYKTLDRLYSIKQVFEILLSSGVIVSDDNGLRSESMEEFFGYLEAGYFHDGFQCLRPIVFDNLNKYKPMIETRLHLQMILLYFLQPIIEKLKPRLQQDIDNTLKATFTSNLTLNLSHVFNEYPNRFIYNTPYIVYGPEVRVDPVGISVFSYGDVQDWLRFLVNKGINIHSTNPNVMSPISFSLLRCDFPEKNLEQIKYCMENQVDVSQRLIRFSDDHVQRLANEYKLPDALWLAAWICKEEAYKPLLKYLLRFWSAPALTLLIFLHNRTDFNQISKYALKHIYPVLVETGGPLPLGTKLFNTVKERLVTLSTGNDDFRVMLKQFTMLHKAVPTLKQLCRTVVRANVPGGNDLPRRLASLELSDSLKPYLLLDV